MEKSGRNATEKGGLRWRPWAECVIQEEKNVYPYNVVELVKTEPGGIHRGR
jgi:hypothetical protein